MRSSAHITAVLLLMLTTVAVVVGVALWLYERASSPAAPPPRLEVSVEAVKAYAVPGLGTYIGIYERNVGDASIEIKRLEELGIGVYVYNWRGDLVAYNTSARVAKEGVPDGVWEPGELIVVEAFVPVVLSPASFAVTPLMGGYRVVEEIGAGGSVARLEATLRLSDIKLVENEPRICYMVLLPGTSMAVNPVYTDGAAPLTPTTLYAITLDVMYLNDTSGFTLATLAYGGYYPWITRVAPWLPPLIFLLPFFAYTTITANPSSAAAILYSTAGSALGGAPSGPSPQHRVSISFTVPAPAGLYRGIYVNYTDASIAAVYDGSRLASLQFRYLQPLSNYFFYALTVLYNGQGYLGVKSITLTYYDATTGATRTFTWSPNGEDDTLPSWLAAQYYTIECKGTVFKPSW